jgi:N-methylhydantoinase B
MDDDGVHRFTVLAKAHMADCGNSAPTTYMAQARDVYEEGAPIFPCVLVQRDYQDIEDVIRMCRLRIRVPEQWWGDHLAILGAARVGERKLLELGEEVGWETLQAFAREWFEYSERRMVDAVRKLPSGQVSVTTSHDPYPGVPEGLTIQVKLRVDAEDARIEVDLTDNPDCVPCGLNLSEACAITAACTGIFNSIDHTVPANAGSFRRIDVRLRENCVVGIPRHPTSCSAATTNLSDRVANATQRAMSELGPGLGLAEIGCTNPLSGAVISGHDPRANGAPFVNQLILALASGGAGPFVDGWLGGGSIGNGGQVLQDSVEVDELKHPIRIHAQHILPDTEGAGQNRGGPSNYVEYGPVDCELEIMYASDGTVHPPKGTQGGESGSRAEQYVRRADGSLSEALPPYGRITVKPGETVVSISCSGGGYGLPARREPERVAHDVREGWITADRAFQVYGVALDESRSPNHAATMAERASKDSA